MQIVDATLLIMLTINATFSIRCFFFCFFLAILTSSFHDIIITYGVPYVNRKLQLFFLNIIEKATGAGVTDCFIMRKEVAYAALGFHHIFYGLL